MRRSGGERGRRLGVLTLTLLAVCAFTSVLPAREPVAAPGVPRVMMYEGYITDVEGQPLPDGPYDFRFFLYETAIGGTPVWTEEHLGVEVSGGVVQVRLGEGTTPTALDLPFDVQYYLGIRVGDDPEMVPRLRLMTTAYAFRAGMADEVPDGSITGEKLEPLAVTDEHIASVSWEKITDAPEAPVDVRGRGDGPVPSSVWHIKGNRGTDPTKNYVGTSDEVALNLATHDSMRLVIESDGKIKIDKELEVGDYITSRKSDTEGGFLLADRDHGLKRVGNDNVRLFTTGGHLLLEGGNVGIGTAGPTAKLHVIGTGAGGQSDINSYPIRLDTHGQGMAINIDRSLGTAAFCAENNYVSFWDEDGMRGRIEAQCNLDLMTHPRYIYFTLVDGLQLGWATVELIGAISDVRFCAGFGAVTCPPSIPVVAAKAVALGLQAVRAIGTQVFMYSYMGVAYRSSAGDYAEWLERVDPDEVIVPGDIVGVFGGRVTKSTRGAHQLMVASHAPIVLGNSPPEEEEHLYSKIAFMGQVLVKITGPVSEGDYIIPSGLDDGTAVAVSPELMTFAEYPKVVGRAWGASQGDYTALVTVAVGLSQGDMAEALGRQQWTFEALRSDVAARETDVLELKSELAELEKRVGDLDVLQQELATIREAVLGPAGIAPAEASPTEEAATSGSSW